MCEIEEEKKPLERYKKQMEEKEDVATVMLNKAKEDVFQKLNHIASYQDFANVESVYNDYILKEYEKEESKDYDELFFRSAYDHFINMLYPHINSACRKIGKTAEIVQKAHFEPHDRIIS